MSVVPPGFLGFLTIYSADQTLPNASTLNSLQGQVVANAAIVPCDGLGRIDAYASNPTDLIIDINGYYAPAGDFEGNVGVGSSALRSITSGQKNTALGDEALEFNATGSWNTATGAGALFFNVSGTSNTATGYRALYENGSGNSNSAFGYRPCSIMRTALPIRRPGFKLSSTISTEMATLPWVTTRWRRQQMMATRLLGTRRSLPPLPSST